MHLKAFWDNCHLNNDQAHLTYSGYMIKTICETHRVFQITDNILEIGIGNGANIRNLKLKGYNAHAFDISTVALERLNVQNLGIPTYSTYDQIPRNYFDIIMSFHVSEHMSPDQLKDQIKVMLECLKNGGTYFMSFAESPDDNIDRDSPLLEKMKAGSVYYSKEQIEKIVEECNGNIEIFSIRDTCLGAEISKK